MHICGMDFSSLASYWQIKALLMLEPSVTPQNQYFPADAERMAVHCLQLGYIVSVLHQDEGGIGKSIPDDQKISRDPRDFPRAKYEGNLEGRYASNQTLHEIIPSIIPDPYNEW